LPSARFVPKSSSVFGFGVAVKANRREVGEPSAVFHLGQDRALQLLLRRLGAGLFAFRSFERAGGEYGL